MTIPHGGDPACCKIVLWKVASSSCSFGFLFAVPLTWLAPWKYVFQWQSPSRNGNLTNLDWITFAYIWHSSLSLSQCSLVVFWILLNSISITGCFYKNIGSEVSRPGHVKPWASPGPTHSPWDCQHSSGWAAPMRLLPGHSWMPVPLLDSPEPLAT